MQLNSEYFIFKGLIEKVKWTQCFLLNYSPVDKSIIFCFPCCKRLGSKNNVTSHWTVKIDWHPLIFCILCPKTRAEIFLWNFHTRYIHIYRVLYALFWCYPKESCFNGFYIDLFAEISAFKCHVIKEGCFRSTIEGWILKNLPIFHVNIVNFWYTETNRH